MAQPYPRQNCPKCNRSLAASGELHADGRACPVYSCDECLVTVDFGGEKFEQALTFMLNEKGEAVDPTSPDSKLHF